MASDFIERYSFKAGALFVNNVVICELVWVLSRGYRYKKHDVVVLLKNMFTTTEFVFEGQAQLWKALEEYK